jgi:hypothetical protein
VYLSGVDKTALLLGHALCRRVLRLAARSWTQTWPVARPARSGLDIALHPSPLARRAHSCFVIVQLLFVLELAWLGHWVPGAAALTAAACWPWLRRRRRHPTGDLRRLLLAADGRMHGLTAGGAVVALRLHPASLSLGRWLLLRLQDGSHSHLLLLGPDNMMAGELASLRRRLIATRRSDFD